ncbi:MAG TPA: hypothetical protein VFQ23_06965 [Anaerolineales bacterium]|nr:hypothetical protein [Anaerolineales bacterium]
MRYCDERLTLARDEAGKLDYFPQVVSVAEICKSGISFITSQALKKSVTVTYDEQISQVKIYADPRLLKQILVNLRASAIKFTPEKGEVGLQINADLEKDLIQFGRR